MMVTYQNYPSGFRTSVVAEFRADTTGDKDVKSFMNTLKNALGIEVNTWEFRRNVLITGQHLFGDFKGFLNAQEQNANLSPHQRALLADTIAYINTGRRPIALHIREQLISTEREDGFNTWPVTPMHFAERLSIPVGDYMYHWLSWDEGFLDLLCTLNLVFGEPQESGFTRSYL